MHNLRFLLTGADGFIGSHLVQSLVIAGHQVLRAFAFIILLAVGDGWNHCQIMLKII